MNVCQNTSAITAHTRSKLKKTYNAYNTPVKNDNCSMSPECVVDPNDTSKTVCVLSMNLIQVLTKPKVNNTNLLQIKLPYDGSNPYNGCGDEISEHVMCAETVIAIKTMLAM